jgi:hypothetical protein
MKPISGNPLGLVRHYDVGGILLKIIEGLDVKPGVIGINIINSMGTVEGYELADLMINHLPIELDYLVSNRLKPYPITTNKQIQKNKEFAKENHQVIFMNYEGSVPDALIKEHDIFIVLNTERLDHMDGSLIYINE